ncbi:lysozyme inhibitor LprI family protein [Cytobacillus sp.]|uniref:lysozyme inhibitor LprI family protein n=1 Tax=Cytobacillus sp. TaxID=2675269 RepID=UPI0028BD1866|nr:lysozyme inhibitor LprI family protein [Cytobacillus sp.]
MRKLLGIVIPFLLLFGCSSTSTGNADKEKEDASVVSEEGEGKTEDGTAKDKEEVLDENKTVVSTKEQYLEKLSEIEKSLADLEDKIQDGTQTEMNKAQAEIFVRWDKALNEIYQTLEKQLSTAEMEDLREEQRQWIKQRDETAKEESLEFEGGTLESFQYTSTQARMTKERCYVLVKDYMK